LRRLDFSRGTSIVGDYRTGLVDFNNHQIPEVLTNMDADRAAATVIELQVKRFVVNRGAAIIPNVIYVENSRAEKLTVRFLAREMAKIPQSTYAPALGMRDIGDKSKSNSIFRLPVLWHKDTTIKIHPVRRPRSLNYSYGGRPRIINSKAPRRGRFFGVSLAGRLRPPSLLSRHPRAPRACISMLIYNSYMTAIPSGRLFAGPPCAR